MADMAACTIAMDSDMNVTLKSRFSEEKAEGPTIFIINHVYFSQNGINGFGSLNSCVFV